MPFDSMTPWTPALLALVAALAWAALFRRRPALAGLALPVAALIGVTMMLGVVLGSPRQLAERLPALALAALLIATPLALGKRRWLAWLLTRLGAAFCGWWMAGGPMTQADLLQAVLPLLAVALTVEWIMAEPAAPWRSSLAALALAAGLWASGIPGPWFLLALVLAGATLGQEAMGGGAPDSARLPLAMLLTALLAGTILARGAQVDWVAALAPMAPLLLSARLARLKGWRAWPALLVLTAAPVALAWWLARGA